MVVGLSIFSLVCGLILVVYGFIKESPGWATWGTMLVILNLVTLIDEIKPEKPTALDVYRGKTILQITYKDSVALDSVVVWK